MGILSKHQWGVSQIPLPCFYCFLQVILLQNDQRKLVNWAKIHTLGGFTHVGKIPPFFRSNSVPKLVSRCLREPDQNADKWSRFALRTSGNDARSVLNRKHTTRRWDLKIVKTQSVSQIKFSFGNSKSLDLLKLMICGFRWGNATARWKRFDIRSHFNATTGPNCLYQKVTSSSSRSTPMLMQVCNGEGEEECRTLYQSSCTTRSYSSSKPFTTIICYSFSPSIMKKVHWEKSRKDCWELPVWKIACWGKVFILIGSFHSYLTSSRWNDINTKSVILKRNLSSR